MSTTTINIRELPGDWLPDLIKHPYRISTVKRDIGSGFLFRQRVVELKVIPF